MGNWQLFVTGILLVTILSIVDVVFVIAMINIGKLQLGYLTRLAAVTTYAISALLLQVAVVLAYRLTPNGQRAKTLYKIQELLLNHSNQVMCGISLLLGCILVAISILSFF